MDWVSGVGCRPLCSEHYSCDLHHGSRLKKGDMSCLV